MIAKSEKAEVEYYQGSCRHYSPVAVVEIKWRRTGDEEWTTTYHEVTRDEPMVQIEDIDFDFSRLVS